jgi:hypothetical protein
MAKHLNMQDLNALPVMNYIQELRPKVRSGDLLFASGDYWISKAIQLGTHSPWSHIGIVFRLQEWDRVLLLESVEDVGVRFTSLSKYLNDYENDKPYAGRVALARYRGMTKSSVREMGHFGADELTRPYDRWEIAHIILRVLLRMGRSSRNRDYICSELVLECFAKAGIHFPFDPRGFISPEHIGVDNRVSLLGRIL